jgi:hypothetical protein
LAHSKPQLVRGAAEVARPALAAEPLATSTYCPPASKVGCAAGDQPGRPARLAQRRVESGGPALQPPDADPQVRWRGKRQGRRSCQPG